METLFWIVTPLTYVFWAISVAFGSTGNVLQYRYVQSIFNLLPKDSFLGWYFQPPKDTWERKYSDIKILKRKKFLGATIPAMFFDAWHGLKIMRQFFTWLTFIACSIAGTTWVKYEIYPSESVAIYSVTIIFGSLIAFAITTHTIHVLFFNYILIKRN